MWNLPTPRYVKAYEPKLNTYSSKKTMKKERSLTEDTQESFSSSGDAEEDLLPEIVPVSSLGSFSDSSTVSAASSPGGVFAASSPASPTRSIFKNYWASSSSPRACRVKGSYDGDDTEETELLLRKLSLPFVDEGDSSPAAVAAATISSPTFRRSASAQVAQSPAMVKMNNDESIPPRRSSIDDTSIDYGWNNKTRRVTASPRRQILPTIAPPPPPPVSVTNDQASHPVQLTLRREQFQRNYSSTTALIKRPTHSCLRPSRYSCSMIDERRLSTLNNNNNNKDDKDVTTTTSSTHAAAAIASRSTLTRSKSVSFYSQVSVFEFFEHSKMMDDHPSEEVWSKYFA